MKEEKRRGENSENTLKFANQCNPAPAHTFRIDRRTALNCRIVETRGMRKANDKEKVLHNSQTSESQLCVRMMNAGADHENDDDGDDGYG